MFYDHSTGILYDDNGIPVSSGQDALNSGAVEYDPNGNPVAVQPPQQVLGDIAQAPASSPSASNWDARFAELQSQLGNSPDASNQEAVRQGRMSFEEYARMERARAAQGGSGAAQAAGGNWFAANAPNGSGYGAPPAPFGERYTAGTFTPGTYTAPTWMESFTPLTMEQVKAEPGYQTRLDAGNLALDRGASSRGSLLSGGMLKARERYAQDYAANEYGAATGRAFDQYRQRYGEFGDAASRGLSAFNTNEAGRLAGFTANEGGQLNQYNTRYRAYQDEIENTRRAEQDRWTREMDLGQLGLSATLGGRP